MKFLLTFFLLSSLLFSAQTLTQKQVIVGCYSVKSNAKEALELLNKQIQNDAKLKDLMKKEELRVINTNISAYTVVSINYFESYMDIYELMKVLKPYYNDLYALHYPTRGIEKEYLKGVKKKAEEEALAEAQKEKQRVEEEALEVRELLEEEAKKVREELHLEAQAKKLANLKETAKKVQKEEVKSFNYPIEDTPINAFEKEKFVVENKDIELENYYILIGLVIVFLILSGLLISRKFKDKMKGR